MPVKEKTATLRTAAIGDLLVGLARVKARSRFFLPLRSNERTDYEKFAGEWAPKCEAAIDRLNEVV